NVNAVDRDTARSGAIQIERFTPKPYEPSQDRQGKDMSKLRFATSQVGCDNAGKVLEQLGYRSQMLDHSDFRSAKKLKGYDLVFINCVADITQVLGAGLFLNAAKNALALR